MKARGVSPWYTGPYMVFSFSYKNLEMLVNKTHGRKVEENRHLFEHKI